MRVAPSAPAWEVGPRSSPLEPLGALPLELARPLPRARPPTSTMGAAAPPRGVSDIVPTGIGVIGFEGVTVDAPVIEDLVGAVPRARGISATGVGLERVLEQGGRAPEAGLTALLGPDGSPSRLGALGREVGLAVRANLDLYRQEADILPAVRAVSEEALRMLDAYLNRTDELHPLSRELLAQGFTGAGERLPATGEKVPLTDVEEPSRAIEAREAVRARFAEAGEGAAAAQLELAADRARAAERVAGQLGFYEVRGALIDQRL